MKLHSVWIVWLLACTSLVLCQDGTSTNNSAKNSILPAVLPQGFEVTTLKTTFTTREEQIEDELSDGATTTDTFMEKRKFIIKPIRDEEYREIFTVRFNDSAPTTIRSSLSTTKRTKALFSSGFIKHDETEDGNYNDDVTTSYDGLTKKSHIDNGERKIRQRLEGLKGVTTNRGKTKFQNEPGTSEVPEILSILRHKKPIRVKSIEQIMKDDVDSTTIVDDFIDTTTVMDNFEIDYQRPKFKKPPLIATHHPNFGTTTEASRRPAIRPNINLKQKISSSTIKTRLHESDVIESESVIPNNKSLEIVSSNTQLNKIRPIKGIAQKGQEVQQPIPPTATAWALASLKAPNNSNRILRKPINITNIQEPITKIKPFVTWSTRLQKPNEENSNITGTLNNTLVNEPIVISTEYVLNKSSTADRLTFENASTDSSRNIIDMSLTSHSKNDSAVKTVGGDTDQNKYEVYGSQKPDIENATTVIETLRPSSSTITSESQNSNLLLVTSYKSILENNNTSEVQQDVFTSSEIPMIESTQKKEVIKDELTKIITEQLNNFQNGEETQINENSGNYNMPVLQTSTETFSKTPGLFYDYSEDHDGNKSPTTMTGVPSSSSDKTFLNFHDSGLSNQNHSTTTEYYIESIKNKLEGKITESTGSNDSLDLVDFTHMFSSDRPIFSSTDRAEFMSTVLEKTTSELPPPSNAILNSSQVPSWSTSPDISFTDNFSKSTNNHDDSGDDGQKTFESSSQSSLAVNEQTSDSDISENDVPIIITSSTSTTTMPTTALLITTMIMPSSSTSTFSTPTTTTTSKPITTTSTTGSTTLIIANTTTTTTTPRPITTTMHIPRPTTTITPNLTTTTTTTPRPTSTTTTIKIPITTPVVIETTTPTTTTMKNKATTTSQLTTIYKQNSITSRPKPAVVDLSSTTFSPNIASVKSYLQILVNSTMDDICDSEDELKDAIIKLFESGTESVRTKNQIQFLNVNENECLSPDDEESPVAVEFYLINSNGDYNTHMHEEFINLLNNYSFDYKSNIIGVEFMRQVVNKENSDIHEIDEYSKVKSAIYLSCVAVVCSLLVIILLIVRKRQKRFNYGQRCTPVSLDDYSMDNISVYNSVRRKNALRASKRSYGNPAFDDSSAASHSLNFAGLASFSEDRPAIDEEFSNIPVITVKSDELPPGTETKNRYANVIPMPETRVLLNPRSSAGQNSDYINANFVKGYKGAEKFYIACQAPMQSTIPDFWQMIWDQNTRVIMMVTSLTEKGVERCADYLPPSEVLDCHRLFGDYQVTLKKREVKDKFIISNLQLKNLESNLWRDVTHLWYGGWPVQGVPSDPGTMLAFLLEVRSHMKTNNGPHVVHCSPGTGRTGTVIACDICIREFEVSRTVDVPKTVYAIRRCRAGAVQTREQYALIYKVVNLYASKLSGGVLDSI